jgi:hypothetical protein
MTCPPLLLLDASPSTVLGAQHLWTVPGPPNFIPSHERLPAGSCPRWSEVCQELSTDPVQSQEVFNGLEVGPGAAICSRGHNHAY